MSAVESRAVRFHEVGEPLDVLVQEQVQVPDPGAGRIRVRVRAAGLNPADPADMPSPEECAEAQGIVSQSANARKLPEM